MDTYLLRDVSSVISMRSLFNGKTTFNEDIGNWDVSSVTDMWYMFQVKHQILIKMQVIGMFYCNHYGWDV